MREFTRWTDQYPTLTFGISVTSDNIADLRGKSWRVRIPFEGCFYDNRPGVAALFGGFMTANMAAIDGVFIDWVQSGGAAPDVDAAFDPRAQVHDCVELLLTFADDTDAFGPVPLVVTGMAPADEAKTATADPYETNDNKFVVTDKAGGTVACWVEEFTGTKGEKGDTGAQGPAGADGDDGAPGTQGPEGESAYEVALDNGFEGTEAEWLLSLKGEKGDDGAAGADGADGSIIPRVTSTASSATPTPDADTTDHFILTALATDPTFGAPTGTPDNRQKLIIEIYGAAAQALAWNTIYASRLATLPTTTTADKWLMIGLMYDDAASKWFCVAVAEEA